MDSLSASVLRCVLHPGGSHEAVTDRFIIHRNALCYLGPSVEAAATQDEIISALVPETFRANQQRRDSNAHHITVVPKTELKEFISRMTNPDFGTPFRTKEDALKWVLKECAEQEHTADWTDVGLGRATETVPGSPKVEQAYFKVILWPSGTLIRQRMRLPPVHFHITVGFKTRDLHDCDKGVLSRMESPEVIPLLSLPVPAPSASSDPADIARPMRECAQRLVELAEDEIRLASSAVATPDRTRLLSYAKTCVCVCRPHELCRTYLPEVDPSRIAPDTDLEARALCLTTRLQGQLEDFQSCADDAARLVELQPRWVAASLRLGFALMRLRNYAAAIAPLERATELARTQDTGSDFTGPEPSPNELASLEKALALCRKMKDQPRKNHRSRSPPPRTSPSPPPPTEEDGADCPFDVDAPPQFCNPRVRITVGGVTLPRNTSCLIPGWLLGTSKPKRPEQIVALRDHFNAGLIVTIYETVMDERVFASEGVEHMYFVVENYKAPTRAMIEAFVEKAEQTMLERERSVVVHCGGGKGRAGTLLACFLAKHGFRKPQQGRGLPCRMSAADAVQALRKCRPGSIETKEQEASIRDYVSSLWMQADQQQQASSATATPTATTTTVTTTTTTAAVGPASALRPRSRSPPARSATTSGRGRSRSPPAGARRGRSPPAETGRARSPAGSSEQITRYPSTPHLPFSPEFTSDDIVLAPHAASRFVGIEIVITEKMDGGNCCLSGAPGKPVFARTHSHEATHPSFSAVKSMWQAVSHHVPEGVILFGENMAAVHSIEYDALQSYFYLFGAFHRGRWASWDGVCKIADDLGFPTVPVRFRGVMESTDQLKQWMDDHAKQPSSVSHGPIKPEGFVVRLTSSFGLSEFDSAMAKYVRRGHVQTDATWSRTWRKARLSGTPPQTEAEEETYTRSPPAPPAASPAPPAAIPSPPPRRAVSPPSQALSKQEVKRKKAEDKARKTLFRQAPRLIVLSGLPGSGKSTFAKQLTATCPTPGGWAHVCQDDLGSSGACDTALARVFSGRGKTASRCVLDRCNPSPADRRHWLSIAMDPHPAVAVHFACDPEECRRRVQARRDHPTIPFGRGARVVASFQKQMVPPTREEGFDAVVTVTSLDDANRLLQRYGSDPIVLPPPEEEDLIRPDASAALATDADWHRMAQPVPGRADLPTAAASRAHTPATP